MRTEVIKYLQNRNAGGSPLVDPDFSEYTIEEAKQLDDTQLLSVLLATTARDAVEMVVEYAEQHQIEIK